MPQIYNDARTSCECGSTDVGSHNYEGEEHGMWACGDCGFTDYPDAFDNPIGFIDDNCPTCKKETKHQIGGFDDWTGVATFRCTNCKTGDSYKVTGYNEFTKIRN